jgi:hypothetical protein
VLEDENGQDYQTLYLGAKQGLSAGWRGFAVKHDIKVGDVVIFQLVRPTKFKARFFLQCFAKCLVHFVHRIPISRNCLNLFFCYDFDSGIYNKGKRIYNN